MSFLDLLSRQDPTIRNILTNLDYREIYNLAQSSEAIRSLFASSRVANQPLYRDILQTKILAYHNLPSITRITIMRQIDPQLVNVPLDSLCPAERLPIPMISGTQSNEAITLRGVIWDSIDPNLVPMIRRYQGIDYVCLFRRATRRRLFTDD